MRFCRIKLFVDIEGFSHVADRSKADEASLQIIILLAEANAVIKLENDHSKTAINKLQKVKIQQIEFFPSIYIKYLEHPRNVCM